MRKIIATVAVFLLAGACVVGVVALVQPDALSVRPTAVDSPCPVVGCASGECHGFDDVPEPDGVHEMTCPEASCASVECHGWETLSSRYHQASDASLNLWILAPTALVLVLWLLVRKSSREGRRAEAAAAEEGACHEA